MDECSAVMSFTIHEFSTVNTGLGRSMFSKPLCLLSTHEGLTAANYKLT